jgi:RNA:NAD 2'-phosphotransferase (TPT1/KptA family)
MAARLQERRAATKHVTRKDKERVRHEPVVLTIAAGEMHSAGRRFHRSANGVWLTDVVPPEYIVFW